MSRWERLVSRVRSIEARLGIKGWQAVVGAVVVATAVAVVPLAPAHDLVHWLDDLRHEIISTFAWEAVKTNLGANGWWIPAAGLAAAIAYPPLRAFVKREWDHMHAKLDHIIEHHPEIPPFPKGRPGDKEKP